MLIAESLDFCPLALEQLRGAFDVQAADLQHDELLRTIGECEYLWVRLRTMIDRPVFDAAPKLKAVLTNTTGLNHIDLDVASERGVEVISLRGEVDFLKDIRATAEHTLTLALALLRKIPAAHQHAISGKWSRDEFTGHEIYRRRVGIIGYGRLGRIVARYFAALGADVSICDPICDGLDEVDQFPVFALERILSDNSLISLHANFHPANRNMLSRKQFEQMARGSYFINTSRGELVDESALADAIADGRLAGAAIDVRDNEHEPTSDYYRLLNLAATGFNLVITPHIGGNTCESRARTELYLAEKLIAYLRPDATTPSISR